MAIQKIKEIIVVTEDGKRIIYHGKGTSNCQNNAYKGEPQNWVVSATMKLKEDGK